MKSYSIRRWYGSHDNNFDQLCVYRDGELRPFLSLRIERGATIETPDGTGLEPERNFDHVALQEKS